MTALLIARNTFREASRDRVLMGLTVAGLVIMIITQVLSPLAVGEGGRITVDLGLSAISLLGVLAILLVGTSLVAKEIERRTIFNLLSRPIPRPVYLVGKWAGLTASLWAVAGALGIGLWLILLMRGGGDRGPAMFEAVYLAALELAVVTSIAVLCSALSTPVLSALYTLGFFCVGQWSGDLRAFSEQFPEPAATLVRGAASLAPNLPLFNMRTLAAAGETTTLLHLGIATGYALLYVTCVLALASAAFESRDFK